MKKILTALLAACLMITCLTGCSDKNAKGASANLSDWDYLEQKGELVVGMTLFAPMNYKDDSGKLIGFETEFAQALTKKLGIRVKFQEIDWNSKETELNSKNIDCIWNGMTVDEERKQNMDLSVSYLENRQILVTKSDRAASYTSADQLKGISVVAEKGSAGETVATTDPFFAQAKYTAVDSQAKALMEVKSGTADAAVIDYVMSIGSIGVGTDYADLAVAQTAEFSPEEYAIAFRKNSPATLEKVNGAISDLAKDGTLKQIAQKYKLDQLLLIQ